MDNHSTWLNLHLVRICEQREIEFALKEVALERSVQYGTDFACGASQPYLASLKKRSGTEACSVVGFWRLLILRKTNP
jgi:hypothetical protein